MRKKRMKSPISPYHARDLGYVLIDDADGLELLVEDLKHTKMVGLVSEEQADKATQWLTGVMEVVGDSVVNGDRPGEERVPIKAETKVCTSWGEKE